MAQAYLKTLLLTGNTGFIGQILQKYLERAGYEVIGMSDRGNVGPRQLLVDIRNAKDVQDKLSDIEAPIIVHTAGIIDSALSKKLMFDVNVLGTQNMLDWAKNHGCRHFIQLSSVSVYGYNLLGENRSEKTHRCKFVGINYSKSKAEAERRIEQSGVPFTNLRIPPVLGENDTYITPTIVPRLIEGKLFFGSKKDRQYSMFYVKNIGGVILKLIEHGPLNAAYNCVDYTMPWREYCGEYAKQLGLEMPLQTKSIFSGFPNWNDKHYLLMIGYSGIGASYTDQGLKQAIGWAPEFSWQEGVRDAIKSYMENHPDYKSQYDSLISENAKGKGVK
jgi:nucleoside-diphosphate-sugar epimerase